jgi:hypothetical protein
MKVALILAAALTVAVSPIAYSGTGSFVPVDAIDAQSIQGGACYRAAGVQNCTESPEPTGPCFTKQGQMWLQIELPSGIQNTPTACIVPGEEATEEELAACGHFHKSCNG